MSLFSLNDVDKCLGKVVLNINICRIEGHFATGRGAECVSMKSLRIRFEFLVQKSRCVW